MTPETKGVRMELRGAEEAIAALGLAASRAEHPRPLFDAIGLSLVTSTTRRFELGQSPGGSPWPPSIRAIYTGGKTLIDTGRFLGSITYEATDTSVAVGSNAIQAAIHQFGGTIKPKTGKKLRFVIGNREVFADEVRIPARPYLGLDSDDEKEIEAAAGDFIAGPLGGADARQ